MLISKKLKFRKICDDWLIYKSNIVKESTYYHYIYIINTYLYPEFANMSFNKEIDCNSFIAKLLSKLATKTVRDIITVLKSIFKYIEDEYNIKLKIKKYSIPKLKYKPITIFNKDEANIIEKYCLDNPTLKNIGILICLNTGLRVGEICGLKWNNINLKERRITISIAAERIYNKNTKNSKLVVALPKTDSSIRSIPLSTKLYHIIDSIKNHYDDNIYFLSGRKICLDPRSYQYYFNALLKKLNIKHHKFHALRHTFATRCIEVGMDVKSLSELLGHSDINITLKTYVHSSDVQKMKYLERL